MKNKIPTTLILAFVIIAALIAFSLFKSNRLKRIQSAASADQAAANAQLAGANPLKATTTVTRTGALNNSTVPPNAALAAAPVGQRAIELDSLDKMTKTLFEFTKPNRSLNDLVDYLKASHQQPILANDKNEFTGEMTIVRTESPLPGTRYFHAQYFSGGEAERFVQHMSFEFRPSPTAMDDAIKAVAGSFPNLGKPQIQTADFKQWTLENGYIIWIKRLGAADLKDNPFNAYTAADVGTVRVAIELNPHED